MSLLDNPKKKLQRLEQQLLGRAAPISARELAAVFDWKNLNNH